MAPLPTPPCERLLSADEFMELPDQGPCELVEGRIVPMTPPAFEHGEFEATLAFEVKRFADANQLGRVSAGEVGIVTRQAPDTVRGADIVFISHARLGPERPKGFLRIAPELVVEVLSPSNTNAEVRQKLREYFEMGVTLVWIVDPATRSVDADRSLTEVRTFTEDGFLTGDEVLLGFSLPVSRIFE